MAVSHQPSPPMQPALRPPVVLIKIARSKPTTVTRRI
ncbi:Protein of unknown function [Lactobacillus helveticus CIRM-BIA 101]|nr:Protein of unknown function [Lactobacillus helveticus CIRM-BIA 101]